MSVVCLDINTCEGERRNWSCTEGKCKMAVLPDSSECLAQKIQTCSDEYLKGCMASMNDSVECRDESRRKGSCAQWSSQQCPL